jgi:two-component system OmpR family response regulator
MPARALQRVLFVDDDEVVQNLVRIALERIGGMTVELVNDSSKALDGIRGFTPDMVVLDCIMPRVDGVEVFKLMREDRALATIPVVFLTVKAHWRTIDDLRALGAAGVITKPFAARELADQLKAIWGTLPERATSGT